MTAVPAPALPVVEDMPPGFIPLPQLVVGRAIFRCSWFTRGLGFRRASTERRLAEQLESTS